MMASGGKGNSKLERHETEFPIKCIIDLKRFAYDTIKYSALKFNVQEICISVWEGPENAYGCSKFCSEMFRAIVHFQILLRYECHACFKERYESNNLESFELIASLLIDVINKYNRQAKLDIINKVLMSLSIACELILFLDSKKLNLYIKQLAGHWVDDFFIFEKESFEKAGGLDQIHHRVRRPELYVKDIFDDEYISRFCLPYKDSVKNPYIDVHYIEAAKCTLKNVKECSLQEECEKKEDVLINESLREDGASGIDASQSTRHGTTKKQELFKAHCALAVETILSMNLPGLSFEEPPKQNQVFSVPEINKISKSNLRPGPEHDLQFSLDSSKMKQSREERTTVSVAKDATPTNDFLDARRKTAEEYTQGSSGLLTGPSARSIVHQMIRELNLASLWKTQSSKKKPNVSVVEDATPSDDLGARPKEQASSGSAGLQTSEYNLDSSVEQGIGQLSLDSSSNK